MQGGDDSKPPRGSVDTPETLAEGPQSPRSTPRASRPDPESLPRGTCIGRYVVLEPLGHGGMGVVYVAYDPKLDRRVAIKILRVDRKHGSVAVRARDRLLREAQALAQLSHPNVVAIYDAGTFDDNVFMAMELVDGQTLRARLRGGPRPSWREILNLLIAAGRGLSAAHRVGLIHRDIKPDNLVLGNDGRVRVLDFGLARATDLESDPEQAAEPAAAPAAVTSEGVPISVADVLDSGERRLRSPLTEHGSVLGTPAYMAPEQEDGRAVDAASDQFSFCVTAYEALYGQLPGKDEDAEEPAPAGSSARAESSARARVPSWVRRIILRGMSAAPSERFPSMEALIDALTRDPAVKRRRVLAAVAFAATVAVTTLAFVHAVPTRLCQGGDEQLAGVWDGKVKDTVHRAFLSHGRGYAEETFQRVRQELDAYAQRWLGMRVEACEATRVRGVQSERLLELRMRCLDRRLRKVQSLATVFAQDSSDEVIKQSLSAVYSLPPVEACADQEALLAAKPAPEDPKTARAVEAARTRLDRVEALKEAGSYKAALALAPALADDARRIGYKPLQAEALLVLGYLQNRSGVSPDADNTLREAILVGSGASEDRVVADAWTIRIYNLGLRAHYADALALRDAGEAAVERAGGDPLLRGAFLAAVGTVFNRQEKYAEARPYFEKAIAIEQAIGSELPALAGVLSNLGNVQGAQDDFEGARRSYERSIAIYEKAYGPHHPMVANPIYNLANLFSDHGRYDEGRTRYLRAIEIWEASLGAESPPIADALSGLGVNALELGRFDEAWRGFSRAQEIWQHTLDANHPDLGRLQGNMAEVLLKQKRPAEACEYFQRSLTMLQKSLEATNPSLAFPLTGLGECLLALHRGGEALPYLERALRIREAADSRPAILVDTRFALARALDVVGRDHARAMQLAQRALADTTTLSATVAKSARAEIGAWLASRH